MPNYCDYTMKIKGTKENCMKWLEKMNGDYTIENHFYRIFDADVYDENGTEDEYEMCISGYCAWSLESCCRASGYSNGVDLFEVNTRDLNIVMEAWTQELGICFQEHYIYENGDCKLEEEEHIDVYWWDTEKYETYEEYKADHPGAPSEDEFDDNDNAIIGGFDNYLEWNI